MNEPAKRATKPNGSTLAETDGSQASNETQSLTAAVSLEDSSARDCSLHNEPPLTEETDEPLSLSATHPPTGFVSLEPLAAALDGMERTRIENENRLRAVTQMGGDITRDPDAAVFASVVEGLQKLEHQAELALKRAMRKHPLGEFVANTNGLGEKQTARLLAAIGDPYLRDCFDDDGNFTGTKPRAVSQLWALCGYHVINSPATRTVTDTHDVGGGGSSDLGTVNPTPYEDQAFIEDGSKPFSDPQRISEDQTSSGTGSDTDQSAPDTHYASVGVAPSRRRGVRSNWNATAKMRAFLIAESCVKAKSSPYRLVYDEARIKYADAVHKTTCVRCGPSGKPALAGSPLSLGHQHARGLRLVAKAVLKDLWIEAKRLHDEP